MTERAMPQAASSAEPAREGNSLGFMVLGVGAAATLGWLAFLGWATMSLLGRLIG